MLFCSCSLKLVCFIHWYISIYICQAVLNLHICAYRLKLNLFLKNLESVCQNILVCSQLGKLLLNICNLFIQLCNLCIAAVDSKCRQMELLSLRHLSTGSHDKCPVLNCINDKIVYVRQFCQLIL